MTENKKYTRSADEIEETLKVAGVSPDKLKRSTQVICANLKQRTELDKRKKLTLMELDEHLVSFLEEGNDLIFKSGRDGHIILCSDTHSYEVRETEISNSFILMSGLKMSEEMKNVADDGERKIDRLDIERIFHNFYETRECRPNILDLLSLLSPSSFKGVEYEKQLEESSLYNWERLRENVEMSDGELRTALAQNLVVNINGYYRMIAFEYEATALTRMLDFMEENSWQTDEVDKEETAAALSELIPRPVFDTIFDRYTSLSPKSEIQESTGGNPLYAYDHKKVCQLLAKVLLAASPNNAYDKFMEAWKIGAPERMRPLEEYLSGLALIIWNNKKGRKEVVAFPASKLPDDINNRLNEIFRVKDKWTLEEITPYLSSLETEDMNVNALLTKHTRSSTVNGVKYYSSKHGR